MEIVPMLDDTYEQTQSTISEIMSPGSPEQQMEQRCDMLIRELDELVAFAVNPETVDLVHKERLAIGQMLTRIQLVASVLNAPQPGKLRMVVNRA